MDYDQQNTLIFKEEEESELSMSLMPTPEQHEPLLVKVRLHIDGHDHS
jgi:hypothetical protein